MQFGLHQSSHFAPQNYPPITNSLVNNLLRAAQSVGNVNEVERSNRGLNKHTSASTATLPRGAQRAQGRTFEQKRINDTECPKCELWFTKGVSFNAHEKHNARNQKCL
jgi:hypothetical protein